MKELTKWHRKPLFELVDIQNQTEEQVFFLYVSGGKSQLNDKVYRLVDDGHRQEFVVEVPAETKRVWYENGYISAEHPGSGSYGFILLQNAIDYCELMRKSPLAREWDRFWRRSLERAPETFWGIVAGILSGTGTSIVLHYLFP